MTAEEFVKEKFPYANVERFISGQIKGMQKAYYLCWSSYKRDGKIRLSDGSSKSNAWMNAKKNIQAKEQR